MPVGNAEAVQGAPGASRADAKGGPMPQAVPGDGARPMAEWTIVELAALPAPDEGWRYDDPIAQLKLTASVRRFGQLRPLVLRKEANAWRIVDGRRLLRSMREAGLEAAVAVDLGELPEADAQVVMLALELGFEVNYARLARAVSALLDGGATSAELASASPFTPERIGHFGTLAKFDWSTFRDDGDGQHAMDWDEPLDGHETPAADDFVAPALEPEPELPPLAASADIVVQEPAPAGADASPVKPRKKERPPSPQMSLFGADGDV